MEYRNKKDKKNERKLSDIDKYVTNILKKLNIDKSNLYLESERGEMYYKKRTSTEFIASKKYLLK